MGVMGRKLSIRIPLHAENAFFGSVDHCVCPFRSVTVCAHKAFAMEQTLRSLDCDACDQQVTALFLGVVFCFLPFLSMRRREAFWDSLHHDVPDQTIDLYRGDSTNSASITSSFSLFGCEVSGASSCCEYREAPISISAVFTPSRRSLMSGVFSV
jgi:hypothetical protein